MKFVQDLKNLIQSFILFKYLKMFNFFFRRFPACTFIGTVATGLYIKSSRDPFFFLNAWEDRCTMDKNKVYIENYSLINNALVMWPCKIGEYANFMLFLFLWGSKIEKFYGRKILLATIPVNGFISTFCIMPDSRLIKNDYIESLPITWALMNLIRYGRKIRRLVFITTFLLVILNVNTHDPRIGGISYLIMKFILKYYAKGPLFTYL
jgi:hypothetical protein